MRLPTITFLAAILACIILTPAYAAQLPTINNDSTTLDFPNTLTFAAEVHADSALREIVLEYGVERRTCGIVTALAFPPFDPGQNANVRWTWDMRQSGSLPPGATIWYRWRATDANGATLTSETKRITWIDTQHTWQHIQKGTLNLHWYAGDRSFATTLLNSAVDSLTRLENETGVASKHPIDVYIYESATDMRAAVLYEPGWTGGLAYSEYYLTIIGVAPDNLAWGRRVTAHELTHVLVGDRAFTCIGSIPTWLSEGIAVYGEGGPEDYSIAMLNTAIANNTLLSVRSLSGGFSEDPGQADLSYVQSYSIVRFLIVEYGREKILTLFDRLALGDAIEPVLQEVYGFGLDGLEDHWRTSLQAAPRASAGQEPTATPQPTMIATIVPVGPGLQVVAHPTTLVATEMPTTQPIVAPANETTPQPAPQPDRTLFVFIAGGLFALGAILATVLVVLMRLSAKRRS